MGEREAERFGDHLRGGRGTQELAATTRGSAGAAAGLGSLLESDGAVCVARADGLHLGRVFALFGSSVTPPGTSTQGRSGVPARAIIMAGSPLSQVAMPMTPRR